MEKVWKRGAEKYWKRTHGKIKKNGKPYACCRFASPEDLWKWWMSDNPTRAEAECQMNLF